MVVLDRLTPSQRIAYVLHDLFEIPFRDIAYTLNTSVDNAKKHASRGRKRIDHDEQIPEPTAVNNDVVEAFLAAASGGDIKRMISLMNDDCVRIADPTLIPVGTPPVVVGASAIAQETTLFADRIRASAAMFAHGRVVHVIAPGGHALAIVDITIREGRVARIDISRASMFLDLVRLSPRQ